MLSVRTQVAHFEKVWNLPWPAIIPPVPAPGSPPVPPDHDQVEEKDISFWWMTLSAYKIIVEDIMHLNYLGIENMWLCDAI